MKRLILSSLIGIALLTSCGKLNSFTKQKFTNLKKMKTEEVEEPKQTAIQWLNIEPCDTIKLKSGETIEAEVLEITEKKIRYKKNCSDCLIVYSEKKNKVDTLILEQRSENSKSSESSIEDKADQTEEKKPRNKNLIIAGWASLGTMVIAPAIFYLITEFGNLELGGIIWGAVLVAITMFLGLLLGVIFLILGYKNKKLKKKY